jgi:DNA-binding NarL/FixJ family response regulator
MSLQNQNEAKCALCNRSVGACVDSDVGHKLILKLARATSEMQTAFQSLLRNSTRGYNRKALVRLATRMKRYSELLSYTSVQLKLTDVKGAEAGNLSPREQQIVSYLADGLSNKQVAAKLGIHVRTVETRRARIMLKLNLRSLALAQYAIRAGADGEQ